VVWETIEGKQILQFNCTTLGELFDQFLDFKISRLATKGWPIVLHVVITSRLKQLSSALASFLSDRRHHDARMLRETSPNKDS